MSVSISYSGKYRQTVRLQAVANDVSEHYLLPDRYREMSVTVHPEPTGTTALQVSTSPPTDILTHRARWVDWDLGLVDTPAGTQLPISLTAVRLTAITADATAQIALIT